MKNVKKLVIASLVSAFAIAASGCNMVAKTPEAIKNSPVAKFDKITITKGQLDDRMAPAIKALKAQYGDNFASDEQGKQTLQTQRKNMLDQMINEQIVIEKAKELKIMPTDAELKTETDKKLADTKKQYGDDAKFKDALSQYGITEDTYKGYVKDSIIIEKVNQYVTKDVSVTDQQIKDYYNSNQTQFTEKPDRMHVEHVLLNSEADAKKVRERLVKGEDFAKVAKEVSIEPAAKQSGGDLGFINYTDQNYDKTFMTAALSLKEGVLSEPVQTQYGWHIIKVIKKEEYPVKSLDSVKSEIKATLLNQAQQAKFQSSLEQWKKDAKVKYYDKNM